MRELQKIFLALAGSMIALACAGPLLAEERPAYSDVLFLNQGWTDDDRLRYYYTSAGFSGDVIRHLLKSGGRERADVVPLPTTIWLAMD